MSVKLMFSVIVPTHNEERRIFDTLAFLTEYLKRNHAGKFEIVAVDDGADSTQKILALFAKDKANRLRFYHFGKRLGKGAALTLGILRAKGELCITYDADAAVPPQEIPKMLAALARADVVFGSRKAQKAVIVGRIPLRRRLASKVFNFLVNLLFRLGASDTQCGFKGVRRQRILPVLRKIRSTGFEWDVELLVRAKRAGLKVSEIPVEWHHKKEGKVVLRDTIHMLKGIMRLWRETG
ncbi:MAG: glycosyltransferase [Candidatus Micrarchaeota archaeon]